MESPGRISARCPDVDKMENEKLVLENMGLVGYVVKRYLHTGLEYEDLIQEGMVGLIKAAKEFDVDRGVKFSSFAVICIENAIRKMIRREKRGRCKIFLQAPYDMAEGGCEITLEDRLGCWQKEYGYAEMEMVFLDCVSKLDRQEKWLIQKYFFEGKSQEEIGREIHCTQPAVSRLIGGVIQHMRDIMQG